MKQLGNTKKVENTILKELYPKQELQFASINKRFTRHYSNLGFYLPPSEYVLFNWLVYYSDQASVFRYSAELLKLYAKASDRAIDIYGPEKVHYTTSMDNVRESFVSLIEKGLVIKITQKSKYMINPYVVFCHNNRLFSPTKKHKEYLDIIKECADDTGKLQSELTKLCDSIQKRSLDKLKMDKHYRELNGQGK